MWAGHYGSRGPQPVGRGGRAGTDEADEAPARTYIEEFGDDNLVCSTDYPHADSKFPHAMESFLELPLPEASKQKILWENYAKLYDFPKEGPAT